MVDVGAQVGLPFVALSFSGESDTTVFCSGVDVNLYAHGYNSTGLAGNRENTEVSPLSLQPRSTSLNGIQ